MPLLRHRVRAQGRRDGARELNGTVRALVVAPQWIGDAVMSEPLLAALAARGERVAVAALPSVAPLFAAMPEVTEVLELPFAHGRLDLVERLRLARAWRGRFDVAYVLPSSLKAAFVPWLARVPKRIGYAAEGRSALLTIALRRSRERPPMVREYLALATREEKVLTGGEVGAMPRLALPARTVDAALSRAGLERGGYVVLAPGAEYGPAKRWPEESFARLAIELVERHATRAIAWLGSASERPLCERIAARTGSTTTFVLAGTLSLLESMAVVAASRGVVSNDSGLMHVAAAFGVPQVAAFGSTSPLRTPPLNPRARTIWMKEELGLACMPCFDRTCRYGHYRCLTSIDPHRVAAALAEAIAAGRSG